MILKRGLSTDIEKIRGDFPYLQRVSKENGKLPIYLDNACMTLKPHQVKDAMNNYYDNFPACGGHRGSGHELSREVNDATQSAREKIREFINAQTIDEIIWTRNTTESINLVANCFALKEGDRIISTDREHNSNVVPWQELKRKKGIKYTTCKSNEDNTFNIECFESMMSNDVKLVSMVHTSNLDGYTIPAEKIIKIAHDYGAKVLLDGAQSTPHKSIDVQKMDVDFFAFSIHKMVGPTGMGVLYGKMNELTKLCPFIVGGDTVSDTCYDREPVWLKPPSLFEAGLQNYAGQIGAGAAAEYLMDIGLENIQNHERELNKYISERLIVHKEVEIIGPRNPEERGGIISFMVENVLPRDISARLNKGYNITIRDGLHCVHSWFNAHGRGMSGSARASLYLYNTKTEADIFISGVENIIKNPFD